MDWKSLVLFMLAAAGSSTPLNAQENLRPEWIWANGDRSNPQAIVLRKRLRIDSSVQRADLRMATEFANCELRLNGKTVLTLDDYGPWLDLDVTDHIETGDALIELNAVGSGGPSAILFELTITAVDGQKTFVRSASNWQARAGNGRSWDAAVSFGAVASEFWDADRTARITSFDDYEQWRQASGNRVNPDPATFVVRPGFEIERVRSAEKGEGSWVSLAFDPQGRLIVGREDKGLLRMTLDRNLAGVNRVETIEDTLLECRGLSFLGGSLFAQANNTKELVRLDDPDGDGRFESPVTVRRFPGGVGHGRNDLAVGPDGSLYAIFGDSVDLPDEDFVDYTSPYRESRRGERTTEGHVMRYHPQDKRWDLLSSGLRNPFGIDFNGDGEMFTYDADAEYDMGAPWYRPTRFVQLVAGGDYGWRGRTKTWPPYDADHADFTLPSGNIGKGSPTSVKSGQRSSFPAQYQQAMFALDWAYGRILACHLVPRGAGYVCRAETFLKGRPLNVTDLEFGPDGSLFFVTGGRRTHSNLYRVRWTGKEQNKLELTRQQKARNSFSAQRRQLRRRLSAMPNSEGAERTISAVSDLWGFLGDPDPMIRNAARLALERKPVASWKDRAFDETRPSWVIVSMLALARSEQNALVPQILKKLKSVAPGALSAYDQSMLLETWSRCLANEAGQNSPAFKTAVEQISDWYPDELPPAFAPTGAGRSVNHQLALLASRMEIPNLVPGTLRLLSRSTSQEDRLHALFVLRNCRTGWTPAARRAVFETLRELDRTMLGGEGMPVILRRLREDLVATLSESEMQSLGELVKRSSDDESQSLSINRPVVRKWKSADLEELLKDGQKPPNVSNGRELFHAALCQHCHRVGARGGVVGPDLTSVARRFGRRDILLSILDPSRVVDEKYRNQQVITVDGRVIVGRVVTGGDYRSTKLRLATDALRPAHTVEIDKSEIEMTQPSRQSPMPSGLLDTLSAEEIRDLLGYLEVAGQS